MFEAAKDNAPSVIFIDDADAIFEDGEEQGLYGSTYLASQLKSAGVDLQAMFGWQLEEGLDQLGHLARQFVRVWS